MRIHINTRQGFDIHVITCNTHYGGNPIVLDPWEQLSPHKVLSSIPGHDDNMFSVIILTRFDPISEWQRAQETCTQDYMHL